MSVISKKCIVTDIAILVTNIYEKHPETSIYKTQYIAALKTIKNYLNRTFILMYINNIL